MMMIKQRIKLHNARSGAALLVVLLVVMVITILSLGFLSRSDVELACGQNMVLHTHMDYLAESGLEHAKGLIHTTSQATKLLKESQHITFLQLRVHTLPHNICKVFAHQKESL